MPHVFLGSVVKALVNAAVPLEDGEGEPFSFCSAAAAGSGPLAGGTLHTAQIPTAQRMLRNICILGEGKRGREQRVREEKPCSRMDLERFLHTGGTKLGWSWFLAGRGAPQGAWGGPMVGVWRATSCQKPANPLSTQRGAQSISEGCRGEGKATSPRVPWHEWLRGCMDNSTDSVCSALICPWA